MNALRPSTPCRSATSCRRCSCRPVDRTTLALFAGASGDHNPIHIDIDFARRAGMPDVFAHGMLAWPGWAGC